MTQLLQEAADHAPTALPPHLAANIEQQLTAAVHTAATNFGAYVAADQMDRMLDLASDVLSLPARVTPDTDLVQAAARAMWIADYPPDSHLSWEQAQQQGLADHHLKLAAAAVAVLTPATQAVST